MMLGKLLLAALTVWNVKAMEETYAEQEPKVDVSYTVQTMNNALEKFLTSEQCPKEIKAAHEAAKDLPKSEKNVAIDPASTSFCGVFSLISLCLYNEHCIIPENLSVFINTCAHLTIDMLYQDGFRKNGFKRKDYLNQDQKKYYQEFIDYVKYCAEIIAYDLGIKGWGQKNHAPRTTSNYDAVKSIGAYLEKNKLPFCVEYTLKEGDKITHKQKKKFYNIDGTPLESFKEGVLVPLYHLEAVIGEDEKNPFPMENMSHEIIEKYAMKIDQQEGNLKLVKLHSLLNSKKTEEDFKNEVTSQFTTKRLKESNKQEIPEDAYNKKLKAAKQEKKKHDACFGKAYKESLNTLPEISLDGTKSGTTKGIDFGHITTILTGAKGES